jgi:hypothetical protein
MLIFRIILLGASFVSRTGESIDSLRKAYQSGNLSLYLGAGVSVGSGLPTWDKLVLAMYFSALSKNAQRPWKLYPSYLFATAEWHLERSNEPLEITARKLRRYYKDDDDFMLHLWETLYAGFLDGLSSGESAIDPVAICRGNPTLGGITELCRGSISGKQGVRTVITYNYDSLLEIALADHPFQAVCKATPLGKGKLPIYHVHGYVPLNVTELTEQNIVFTEDQYHQSAKDAYSWANLVQIQSLSSSTGLMIGLSMSDRNMRRLLDAVSQMPVETSNFALLREPAWKKPDHAELSLINEKALSYFYRFEISGIKTGWETKFNMKDDEWQEQITAIIEEVHRVDLDQQSFILEQLGVRPIWFKEYDEITDILASIRT